MKSRRLPVTDAMFLFGETREIMLHVASLMPFTPRPDAPPGHLRGLVDELRSSRQLAAPWNQRLTHPDFLRHPLQGWTETREVDIDYHVRRSALPAPGDERELGVLVSRLHSINLDFHQPPWEMHIIEGLERGRFALYTKVHHSLIDGYTGARMMARSLSADPADLETKSFLTRPPPVRSRPAESGAQARIVHGPTEHGRRGASSRRSEEGVGRWPTTDERRTDAPHIGGHATEAHELSGLNLPGLVHLVREQLGASRQLGKALLGLLHAARSDHDDLVMPLRAPRSLLNRRIGRNRRFATQKLDLARVKALGKKAGATLNDVVLTLCGATLRRFLLELDALPATPLVAMIPVNIRPKGDAGGGNAVAAVLASLATHLADPAERLRAVVASTTRAKQQLEGMSAQALMGYSALLLAPAALQMLKLTSEWTRPAFNVVVSNVPGPDASLYFRGSRLEAYYPVSIPTHGLALNITCTSYAGTLDFGFVGCRDTLPHMQRLGVYCGEALTELEAALR